MKQLNIETNKNCENCEYVKDDYKKSSNNQLTANFCGLSDSFEIKISLLIIFFPHLKKKSLNENKVEILHLL